MDKHGGGGIAYFRSAVSINVARIGCEDKEFLKKSEKNHFFLSETRPTYVLLYRDIIDFGSQDIYKFYKNLKNNKKSTKP